MDPFRTVSSENQEVALEIFKDSFCFQLTFGSQVCFLGICQDLEDDAELRARTEVTKSFLLFAKKREGHNESKTEKKKRKTDASACKLNKRVLMPLVGRGEITKEVRGVPFLEELFKRLNAKWEAPWLYARLVSMLKVGVTLAKINKDAHAVKGMLNHHRRTLHARTTQFVFFCFDLVSLQGLVERSDSQRDWEVQELTDARPYFLLQVSKLFLLQLR